jgi:DNA-binding MarR family transcriptional regulator
MQATHTPDIEGTPASGATDAASGATDAATDALAADLFATVVYLMKSCNADMFRALGLLDVTITQIKLLHLLEDAPEPLTVKQAAERLPLSLPAVSRTVDDLVRRGYVARNEDPDDRRMKRISATDAGLAVSRRLNSARLVALRQFAGTLTETEREHLVPALQALLERPEIAACRPEGTASD